MLYNWHRVMLSGRGEFRIIGIELCYLKGGHECRIIGIKLCYLEGGHEFRIIWYRVMLSGRGA